MNERNLKNLIKELKAEGASEKEAESLSLFSKNISNLLQIERSDKLKLKFLQNIKFSQNKFFKKYAFAGIFSILLLVGFSSVAGAQKSSPGDILYPVKIASENVASFINPSFKNQIIKRRSIEIKEISKKNNAKDFRKTVQTYEKELKENKKNDLTIIQESRRNLEEAQKNSLEENKKDLEKVINQTKNIQESLEKPEVKTEPGAPLLNNNAEKEIKIPNL